MPVKEPEFRLISHTALPIETVMAVWIQSRPTQFPKVFEWMKKHQRDLKKAQHYQVVTAELVHMLQQHFPDVLSAATVGDTFKQILRMPLPILESIHFTWGFANLPIEWREQAVRKRQWGFWLTSMREFTMEDFATDGRYRLPPENDYSPESIERFHEIIEHLEQDYNELLELGWPQEVARKVVPLCATHNGSMFSNLRTLKETISARTCWIAQIEVWRPVLKGMVSELTNVDPLLGHLVTPPCFDMFSEEYKSCKYVGMNENRLCGKDPYAACPLYVANELKKDWASTLGEAKIEDKYFEQGERLLETWMSIWRRDPFSGKLL